METNAIRDWYANFGSFYTYVKEGKHWLLRKFFDGTIGFEYDFT